MRSILLILCLLSSKLMAGKEARFLLQTPAELNARFWNEAHSETLSEDFLEQRKLGWNFWQDMMRPAGSFLAWQSWYSREDLQRIFQHLYEGLGVAGRRQRQALSLASIEAALAWNDHGQFQEADWDPERFQTWLAAYDSDEKMRAVPGLPKILFNRSALIFLLQNYQLLEKCQKKPSDCTAWSWPDQVVFIKTSWRRSEDGFHVDRFASDAAALELQWQKPQWTADASFDPENGAAFALRLPTGQKFHLVGMHASLRLQQQWYWTSLWMDPETLPEEGEGLPWPSRLCAVYGWSRPLARQTIDTHWPRGIAAQALLQKSQSAENWCSNPYLEAGANNHRTNCIGCHQHAGLAWTQQEFTRRLTKDLPSLVQPAAETGPANFVWSVFTGPEALALPVLDSIEYFDVYDPYQ